MVKTRQRRIRWYKIVFVVVSVAAVTYSLFHIASAQLKNHKISEDPVKTTKLSLCCSILEDFGMDSLKAREYSRYYVAVDSVFKQEDLWELALIFSATENDAFNPNIHIPNDGIGLLQVCLRTGELVVKAHPELGIKWEGKKTLTDPQKNLLIGMRYFLDAYVYTGYLSKAIKGYNAGYENKVLRNEHYLNLFKEKMIKFHDYKAKHMRDKM